MKVLGAAGVVLTLLLSAQVALAGGPYTPGGTGDDLGWPNCASSYPVAGFVIAGISHGRPFDVVNGNPNPCLTGEYGSSTDHALYLNTGYDPIYYTEHATADCIQRSAATSPDAAHQEAWAVGCSWAEDQADYAVGAGAGRPAVWWLDVETANSWSSTDLSLNAAALQGGVDELAALTPAIPVGAYSTRYQWSQVVGSGTVSGLAADWVATGSSTERRAQRFCSSSFSGEPVWLVQWVSSVDRDYAC